MKPIVIQGTLLKCSFGNTPMPIMVLPDKKVKSMLPAAVKSDHIPLVNILPLGKGEHRGIRIREHGVEAGRGTPENYFWRQGTEELYASGQEERKGANNITVLTADGVREKQFRIEKGRNHSHTVPAADIGSQEHKDSGEDESGGQGAGIDFGRCYRRFRYG